MKLRIHLMNSILIFLKLIRVEKLIKAVKKNMSIGSSSAVEFKRIAGEKKVNEFRDGLLILVAVLRLLILKK